MITHMYSGNLLEKPRFKDYSSFLDSWQASEAGTSLEIKTYPNPTNGLPRFNYSILHDGLVQIKIYNIMGQKIATILDVYQQRGHHTATWNALDILDHNLANGIYFVELCVNSRLTARTKFVKF